MKIKRIEFSKIIIEGFGSIQRPLTFELDKGGIWLIKGPNGSGKTTLFSALCWCLYQINLKDVVNTSVGTWQESRLPEYRGTRVLVQLNIGDKKMLIVRHLNFTGDTYGLKGDSKLMIFEKPIDDQNKFSATHLQGGNMHKEDMQAYLNSVLGIDVKTFLNSILFGQRMKRLVEVSNEEKRQLFEALFELDFIQKAKDKGKSKKDEFDGEVRTLDIELGKVNTNIINLQNKYNSDKKLIDEFETNVKNSINKVQLDINTTNSTLETKIKLLEAKIKTSGDSCLEEYEKERTNLLKLNELLLNAGTKQSDARTAVNSNNNELNAAKSKKLKLEKDLKDVKENCPYCNNPLNKDEVEKVKSELIKKIGLEDNVINELSNTTKKLEEDLKKASEEYDMLNNNYVALNNIVRVLKVGVDNLSTNKKEADQLKIDISVLKERLDGYKKQISELEERESPKVNLKDTEDKLADNNNRLKELTSKKDKILKELELVNWWLTKGFNSGGIKAFVFNAMLVKLNSYVERYAQRLGVYVRFSVDLTKASKPFITTCYKDGKDVDYKELSGGEKQRIDIALAFAMHDLISQTNAFNILVMDEVMEGLDEAGTEEVFDLIRIKSEGHKTVYMITHLMTIDSLNTKTIYATKDDNTTYLNHE